MGGEGHLPSLIIFALPPPHEKAWARAAEGPPADGARGQSRPPVGGARAAAGLGPMLVQARAAVGPWAGGARGQARGAVEPWVGWSWLG